MAPSLRLPLLCAALALTGCTCVPPVISAAAKFPCREHSDCVGGWRCGADNVCTPADAPADDAGAHERDDAGDDAPDASAADGGLLVDSGTPPPDDAGPVQDAGSAPDDGGVAPDSGPPPVVDAGPNLDDGGVDAGAPLDAGPLDLDDAGPMPDAGPPAPWWNDDFAFRVAVIVDATALNDDLRNFPLPVAPHRAPGFDFSAASASAADVRVVNDDGNDLDFEVDKWAAGDTALWVRVPTLTAGRVHRGWIYFGNSSAASAEDEPAVWGAANHELVLHLPAVHDSAGNSMSFGTTNISLGAGIVADAARFDGSSSRFKVTNTGQLAAANDFTVEGWLRPRDPFDGAGATQALLSRFSDGEHNFGVFLVGAGFGSNAPAGSLVMKLENGEYGYTASPPRAWQAGQWVHFAFVVDTGDLTENKLYLDGALVTSTHGGQSNPSADLDFSGGDLLLGSGDLDSSNGGGSAFFSGRLDEVRLSRTKRSAAWIDMQVAVMRGERVYYGAVESAP